MNTSLPLEPIEKSSIDELRALQLKRLQATLHHAYANSPVYRAKFDAAGVHPDDCRSLADLARRVKDDQAGLSPMLDDLADDAEALQAAEMFEVAVARKFLADLGAVVDALAADKPAEPAETEAANPNIGVPTEA